MCASVPDEARVSLKCRIAIVENFADLEKFDAQIAYENLHRFISMAQGAGVSHVVLHARPAVLSGLSPVKNRQVPSLEYAIVERAARDFLALQVTLNGGISCPNDLDNLQSRYGWSVDAPTPA